LASQGHDCVHALDLGLERANDLEIWRIALAQDRVVISKDEDFVFLANRPQDDGRLVWVRLGNCRNGALIDAFKKAHDELISAIEGGQRIVEIR